MSNPTEIFNARQREIAAKNAVVTGVEIFKVGRHSPMTGETLDFFGSQLAEMADGYNTETHRAPVVVGHPKTDAPAYGWVSNLRVEGDVLVADFEDIDPAFSDLVKAKRYRKISASFFKPDAPNNPNAGQWSLKHVGFLGAAAPAVKGLKEAQFEADNAGIISFGDNDFADLPEQHRKMITRHKTEIAIEKLITQGKILPLHQSGIMDFMDALDDGQSVAFADGTETSKSAWFLEYLEKQPETVSFGEIDLGEEMSTTAYSNTPSGFSVDPDRHALQIQANKLAEAEGISFTDAVSRIEA
ncbi:hypothetical protein JI58_06910 [Marinosulfonomonas sp. PRT-SC04]|nr:hypothetical protein JI58_06910 [Marinosulfonomonas sp. PRT-SC04]